MQRRKLLPLAAILAVDPIGAQVEGESPPRYSILSLIGNKLHVITAQMQTGSRLDRNLHQDIVIPDGSLDLYAAQSTNRELTRLSPASIAEILSADNDLIYENHIRAESVGTFSSSPELSEIFKRSTSSNIILLTKYRIEANLRAKSSSQGHGKLEGLGFYVDHQQRMRRSDTGETGIGYLGIFANIHIWLLERDTRKIIKDVAFSESSTFSAARGESGVDPWNALDATQKMIKLKSMIRTGIANSLPKLLQP
jgi:hypothetical protein